MRREAFLEWAAHFPEPLLLVTGAGEIIARNPAAAPLLPPTGPERALPSLFELAGADREKIRHSLRLWSGCRQMVYGSFVARLPAGEFRCEGAVARPKTPFAGALLLVRLKPQELAAGKFLALNRKIDELSREIIARKQAEAALRASESRFRLWVDLNVIGAGISDLTGNYLEANEALLTLLGRTRADLEAGRVRWRELTPPEYLALDDKKILEAREHGACRPYEKEYFRQDGTRVPVIIGYALFQSPNRYPRQQSDDLAICYVLDLTERKRIEQTLEERVTERTARLQEALAELEGFSYTISHDLRAPLRAMQGYAKWVVADYGANLPPEGRDCLSRMMRASERLDRMILDLLCYTRVARGQISCEPVDLERLLDEVLEQYPNFQMATLRLEIVSPLLPVRGNEALLIQCFANLLGNAMKFVAPGIMPVVKIRTEARGPRVRLWLEDNGIGIEPEDQARLFRMFERLHVDGRYEGNGIGLCIVRKAADRMGGHVGVESTPGQGSRFWIELPAANHAAAPVIPGP